MAQGASQSIEAADELFNFLSKDNKGYSRSFFQKKVKREQNLLIGDLN